MKWFNRIFKKKVDELTSNLDPRYGEWKSVYLCSHCGEIISRDEIYQNEPACRHCGIPSKYLMGHYHTTRRKVYIGRGFTWEWSGKGYSDAGKGKTLPPTLLGGMNRKVASGSLVPTIAAAGLASGLF